jgi:hypothetical protein
MRTEIAMHVRLLPRGDDGDRPNNTPYGERQSRGILLTNALHFGRASMHQGRASTGQSRAYSTAMQNQ